MMRWSGDPRREQVSELASPLEGFERWPTWMWANEEVEDFARWLRDHNHDRPPADQVGFYGLDVYSLWESLRVIIDFLDVHDAEARSGSLEELLHRSAPEQSLFVFPDRPDQSIDWLDARLGHRTIGVVYRPELERAGQYVPTVLGRRDDAFCFFDTTSALRPVPPEIPQADREQETYPCGT